MIDPLILSHIKAVCLTGATFECVCPKSSSCEIGGVVHDQGSSNKMVGERKVTDNQPPQITIMQDQPPTFDAVNVLELRTADASKILKVSVYTNLAEITRLYKFKVKTGQNQVKINGLPDAMDSDSLR